MMRQRVLLATAVSLGLVGCTVRPGSLVSLPLATSGAPAVSAAQPAPVAEPVQTPASEYGTLSLTVRWPARPTGYQTALIPTSTNTLVIKVSSGSTEVASTSVTRAEGAETATANLPLKAGNNLSVEVLAYREAAPVPESAEPIARGTANVNITRSRKTSAGVSLVPLFVPTITALSTNTGVPGDTVTITGTNFTEGTPVQVYFNGYVTGAVPTSSTSVTVTVPPGTPTGKVVVKSDGVSSEDDFVFWVPKTVNLSVSKDYWDHTQSDQLIVLLGKEKQLFASVDWETKLGDTLGYYGAPPSPTWTSADETAGTVDATGLFTAGDAYIAAGTEVTASFGSKVSDPLTVIPQSVSLAVVPPQTSVIGGKGRAFLRFRGINTFSDGATNSFVDFAADASASIDVNGRIVATDFGSNGTIQVTTESAIDTSQRQSTNLTLSNYDVTTMVGNGFSGTGDGTGTTARLSGPRGMVRGASGDLYIADYGRVRKVTPAGDVSTLYVGGSCFGIAEDADGNLYVANANYNNIQRIDPNGVVTVFAGSTSFEAGSNDAIGTSAGFSNPYALAYDPARNFLYVADYDNHRIRKIDLDTRMVTTLAGSSRGNVDGAGVGAKFDGPHGLAVDSLGSVIVADSGNHRIRRITPTGIVSTLPGVYSTPAGVAVDAQNAIYVADFWNHRVCRITPGGEVVTLAGSGTAGFSDGLGTKADLRNPIGVALNPSGEIFVLENGNYALRVLR